MIVVEALARLLAREAEHDRVDHHVVAGGQVHVEADAELDERRQAPAHVQVAAVDVVDPGQALQQRALAASVAARRSRRTRPRATSKSTSSTALQHVEGVLAERVQCPLLERVVLLVRDPERLVDVVDDDRGRRARPRCRGRRRRVRCGARHFDGTLATAAGCGASAALSASSAARRSRISSTDATRRTTSWPALDSSRHSASSSHRLHDPLGEPSGVLGDQQVAAVLRRRGPRRRSAS